MSKNLKRQNKITKIISNILIFSGLTLLLFIYAPFIKLILPSQKVEAAPTKKFTITIPSINAQARVVEQVDPWNKQDYQKALEKGVAHAKGTFLPGQKGTIFLFAHSSDLPWRITRTNTPFIKLPLIKNGDSIFLSLNGALFEYKVVEKKTVNPYDVSFLNDLSKSQVILQTCTPPGTALKRLLVFAEEVKN